MFFPSENLRQKFHELVKKITAEEGNFLADLEEEQQNDKVEHVSSLQL